MKNIYILILLIMLSATLSCQKDISDPFNIDNPTPDGPGNNTGNGDYQPLTTGTFWKYESEGFDGKITEKHHTITGNTKVVNGVKYFEMKTVSPPGISPSYLAINKRNYYTYIDVQTTGDPNPKAAQMTFLYLNDTASIGFKWNYNAGNLDTYYNNQPIKVAAKIEGKILEKDISMEVHDKIYHDVIHTEVDIYYQFPQLGWLNFGHYDFYIAKNIGIIKSITDVTLGTQTETLIDYKIN